MSHGHDTTPPLMRRTTCPQCGAPLEATVAVYVECVAIDEHGRICEAEIAATLAEKNEVFPSNDAVTRIYCNDDCGWATDGYGNRVTDGFGDDGSDA
jgi:hypothetical protein